MEQENGNTTINGITVWEKLMCMRKAYMSAGLYDTADGILAAAYIVEKEMYGEVFSPENETPS